MLWPWTQTAPRPATRRRLGLCRKRRRRRVCRKSERWHNPGELQTLLSFALPAPGSGALQGTCYSTGQLQMLLSFALPAPRASVLNRSEPYKGLTLADLERKKPHALCRQTMILFSCPVLQSPAWNNEEKTSYAVFSTRPLRVLENS